MKLLRSIVLLTMVTYPCFSQGKKIVGRIVDRENQKPIKNARVAIYGTTTESTTNVLGFFELNIDTSKYTKLVISHIRFKTSEIEVPRSDRFKFALERQYLNLNPINLNRYPKTTPSEYEDVSIDKTVDFGTFYPGG